MSNPEVSSEFDYIMMPEIPKWIDEDWDNVSITSDLD